MTVHGKAPFRADHVGSLLRPDSLLQARDKWLDKDITLDELRAVEDVAIKDVVKLQEDLGMEAITDGEFRRESFHVDFIRKIEGIDAPWDFGYAARLGEENREEKKGKGKAPFVPKVVGRMARPAGGIEVENFKYLKSVTSHTPKLCIPSPTMTHFRGGRDAISRDAYPEMQDFFDDLARLYREELADLHAAGCTYVQYDDTNLAYLCDEHMRENVRNLGEDPDKLPETYAALINASIKDRPADMSVCIHLCRGNARSQWFASGGYEPVADKLFNLTEVDGFFLEYDDERSGDFAPLRFVPKGKKVVLGLVTTKSGTLESKDALKARIEEAAKYMPLDQLCLSPQCGFSSNAVGNLVTVDDEKAKLSLVLETAEDVWGSA